MSLSEDTFPFSFLPDFRITTYKCVKTFLVSYSFCIFHLSAPTWNSLELQSVKNVFQWGFCRTTFPNLCGSGYLKMHPTWEKLKPRDGDRGANPQQTAWDWLHCHLKPDIILDILINWQIPLCYEVLWAGFLSLTIERNLDTMLFNCAYYSFNIVLIPSSSLGW